MELVFLLFCVGVGASLKSAWDHMAMTGARQVTRR